MNRAQLTDPGDALDAPHAFARLLREIATARPAWPAALPPTARRVHNWHEGPKDAKRDPTTIASRMLAVLARSPAPRDVTQLVRLARVENKASGPATLNALRRLGEVARVSKKHPYLYAITPQGRARL